MKSLHRVERMHTGWRGCTQGGEDAHRVERMHTWWRGCTQGGEDAHRVERMHTGWRGCMWSGEDTCEDIWGGGDMHGVLYHPSSGQVSLAFRQDPLHSYDDVTQYMWHSPLQYIASFLSSITIASVQPSDSVQFASVQANHLQATSLAHFHKLSHHPHVS